MPCTNGHNNFDDVPTCRICGVNTFVAPTVVLQAPPENNGMAIASMVLGIVWVYGIGSILALVFGYQAKREIARSGQRGSGMATAGIVLGWVGIGPDFDVVGELGAHHGVNRYFALYRLSTDRIIRLI